MLTCSTSFNDQCPPPPPPPPHWEGSASQTIASIYIHSPQSAAGLLFPTTRTHTQTRSGSTAVFFKHQSAQLLQPGRPYGDHITASALPARLGASCDGQAALSLCARGSRNGAALWSEQPGRPIRKADAGRTQETQPRYRRDLAAQVMKSHIIGVWRHPSTWKTWSDMIQNLIKDHEE